MSTVYKRILLKVSGEVLAGEKGHGIDNDMTMSVCRVIKECCELGVQVGVVVGGGNFWRGRSSENMDRTRADHIGMLATVMNSLALGDALSQLGVDARVQTSLQIPQICETYNKDAAVRHLEKGRVVIFGGGTGCPFFSTDTTAALRAAEIGAEVYFKATNVDGVYDKDPNKFADAVKYDELTHTEVLAKGLKVMDSTASSLCRENGIAILVFNLNNPENVLKAVKGEKIGTIVKEYYKGEIIMKTVYSYADEKMTKTINALKSEYASIRAGRASAAVLDKIRVDYYGTPTPVNQLAAISVAEARILTIQPWDKSCLSTIEKAIQTSDLGINPQNDGSVIRLTFPPLTEDRRKEIVKTIRATSEDSKVAIRSIRRDCMDKLKKMEKASEITEDDLKEGEKQIQDKTDKYIKDIDAIASDKEKEIMEI